MALNTKIFHTSRVFMMTLVFLSWKHLQDFLYKYTQAENHLLKDHEV